MKGMEMGLIPVPPHISVLDCELIKGLVPVWVCPMFLLDVVNMILGHYLAGDTIWALVPPPVVVSYPLSSMGLD